jgi:pyruvate ferredoxin oxidoreductase gamma subunit
MFQIRIHGRGGQGVVTAAEMLSVAAFLEGEYAQAFPSFGSERTGAPLVAFCRLDEKPIRSREPVANPDALIIQDPTLLHQPDLFNGISPDGYVLINSTRKFEELGLSGFARKFPRVQFQTVPATELAMRYVKRPMPNAALLGGFAAVSGRLKIESVIAAIAEKFPSGIADANIMAARDAYDSVRNSLLIGEPQLC